MYVFNSVYTYRIGDNAKVRQPNAQKCQFSFIIHIFKRLTSTFSRVRSRLTLNYLN